MVELDRGSLDPKTDTTHGKLLMSGLGTDILTGLRC